MILWMKIRTSLQHVPHNVLFLISFFSFCSGSSSSTQRSHPLQACGRVCVCNNVNVTRTLRHVCAVTNRMRTPTLCDVVLHSTMRDADTARRIVA